MSPKFFSSGSGLCWKFPVGGIILPELLERLGVKHVEKLYCEPTGNFQHHPEPLEKNLGDIMNLMKGGKADVAFVVDPVSYTHLF